MQDKSNKLTKALTELSDELNSFSDVVVALKDLKEAVVDSNEEVMATFVEGTKRLIKKEQKDETPAIKQLEKSTVLSLMEIKKALSEVERGVKGIRLPSSTDFRATGAMLKLPIKELTRAVKEQDFKLSTDAKNPIAVRLSDGENFYKALENFIQQVSGGGATSYAFDTQQSSPTKAATVKVSISGKERDALVVVNPDGSEIGGGEAGGGLTDTELRATPVPVSGTVTANLSATDNAVLDDIAADTEAIKTSLAGTLTVTGGGGGVEYTEGDTDASITGSAILWEDTGDTLRAVSAAKPLPISDAGGTLTVDGTVAVTNAGITTIAGAVSGTEMQVDVLTMPTTTVTATDLDIRPLVNTDVVTAELSAVDNAVLDTIAAKDFATQTTLAAMNAKMVSGTDIGDVTINNSTGAAAVNIQDGGNTITVDGTVAVTNSDITSIKTAVEIIDNAISGSEMQVDVVGALPAGTNAIGKLAANSGVDIGDVDVTSISAGTNLIGDVGIQPRTTNGLDTFMASGSDGSSILVATAQAVKASAGKVYGYYLYNPESAVTFVHFYNTASGSVTVGTTSPLFTLQIPPASAANLMSEIGITFGTAITIAATTTAGGNTAPATGVSATIWYK